VRRLDKWSVWRLNKRSMRRLDKRSMRRLNKRGVRRLNGRRPTRFGSRRATDHGGPTAWRSTQERGGSRRRPTDRESSINGEIIDRKDTAGEISYQRQVLSKKRVAEINRLFLLILCGFLLVKCSLKRLFSIKFLRRSGRRHGHGYVT
jgi:hypothetical protein